MTIQKNVASQKIGFVMVDATDFATPEPNISDMVGHVSLDGGSFVSATNAISEADAALYVLTLQNSETDCDLLAFKATGTGAADQHLIFYPGIVESIVSNILSTVDSAVDNALSLIIQDLSVISGAVSLVTQDVSVVSGALSILHESVISDIAEFQSGFDSFVYGPMGSQMVDWSQIVSDISNIESIIGDLSSGAKDWNDKERAQIRSAMGVSGAVSALEDWGTNSRLDNGSYGLDALETITSDILAGLTGDSGAISALHASIVADVSQLHESVISDIANIGSDSGAISALHESIVSDVADVLAMVTGNSDIISQLLIDTSSTLDNKIDSILADTGTTLPTAVSNVKSVVDDVESNLSDVRVEVDTVRSIVSDTLAMTTGISDITSKILLDTAEISNINIDDFSAVISQILTDTGTTIPGTISDIKSVVDDVESNLSDVRVEVDTVRSIVSDIEAAALTGAQVNSQVDAALDTAIPGSPTADSINAYIEQVKQRVINKNIINEPTGNVKIFEDDDSTSILITSALTSDGTDTTQKKLE